MSLADGRDIAIIIASAFAIIQLLLLIALTAVILAKIGPILNGAKSAIDNVRGTSAFVSDVAAKPIIRAASFAAGVRKAVQMIMRVSGRKG